MAGASNQPVPPELFRHYSTLYRRMEGAFRHYSPCTLFRGMAGASNRRMEGASNRSGSGGRVRTEVVLGSRIRIWSYYSVHSEDQNNPVAL